MSLPQHGRFPYSAIGERPDFRWPNGSRLAVYIGFNLEHFAFGEGLGAKLAPSVGGVDVLNASWREYGNRVGAWRCLELFDALKLPVGAIVNTALIDHAPGLVAAFVARGDELIGHGHTNSEAQGDMSAGEERALLALRAAVEKAIEEHAREGLPMYIWRDGKVVAVPAEELRNRS